MRFKIDWASHVVGSKFTVFASSVTLYLRAYIWRGRFNEGFFALPVWRGLYLEGLIDGGAYFRNFTVWSVLSVEVCLIYSSSDT